MFRIISISILLVVLFTSCDSGEVPSYIAVDNANVNITSNKQGTAAHGLTDCWLNVNGKLVGIFEIPFQVPVLETGRKNIWIQPGIKNNGVNSDRKVYPMLEAYFLDTFLVAGDVLKITPVYEYKSESALNFAFVEGFDGVGHGFDIEDDSHAFITSEGGMEGKCMHVVLDDETRSFECKTKDLFDITKTGEAYLEVNFKCNAAFAFGLFSREISGGNTVEVRKEICRFNPTEEWKKMYIQLNYTVRTASGSQFRPYFTCVRPENAKTENTEFFIDNVKLVYYAN